MLYFKYPCFNPSNTALVMIGSILPDLVKLGMLFEVMGIDFWSYLLALHIPIISLVIAGLFSTFFNNKKIAFFLLTIGLFTHFFLDLFLIDVGGGIYIFFPISWQAFHLDLIPPDDYWFSLIICALVFIIFTLDLRSKLKNKITEKS